MTETFSTPDEVHAHVSAALEAIERLPVGAMSDLAPAVSAVHRLRGAVTSTQLVAPSEAVGTARYQDVHHPNRATEEELQPHA
jgi:hypothetical protein